MNLSAKLPVLRKNLGLRAVSSSFRSKSTVIDGKLIFENILKAAKQDVDRWVGGGNKRPRFSALTAGYDPSSLSYVNIKKKAARFIGIECDIVELRSGHSDEDIVRIVDKLNESEDVDGILIQLPLYPHNDERVVCNAVHRMKDVDGTTSVSLGNLCHNKDFYVPCTALAVHHILDNVCGGDFSGKHAVVIGRSKHVGLPIALLLHSSERLADGIAGFNMTTTIVHRYTSSKQLVELCESADVLVSAAGIPLLVKSDMVKPGAIVIDVGITKVADPSTGKSVFIGDVDFEEVKNKTKYITTVPGGVGPVTVGMLMRNVIKAAKLRAAEKGKIVPEQQTDQTLTDQNQEPTLDSIPK